MAGVVDRVDYWGGATGQNCSGKNAVGQVTVMYLSFPQNISSSIMFCCTYDHRGRQTSESVCYADSTLAQMYLLYDNLGRVGQCFVGIGDDNHVESYAYNLHGNLSALSGDGYTQRLFYENSPSGASNHKRFDGKISSISWTEAGSQKDTLSILHYDGRGRLQNATTVSNPYDKDIESISYQDNGRTLFLNRYDSDGNMCEDLQYSSLGQMAPPFVTNYMDAGEDYYFEYDERSNLTLDELTGFSAAYTLLDRPSRIEPFFGGPVYFTWLADGTKVAQLGDYDEGYDYVGSFRYRRGDDSLRFESFPFIKGRIRISPEDGVKAEYHATDYQGSARRVIAESSDTLTYRYAPYGSLMDEFLNTPYGNEYLFQGKELMVFEGFSLYDFGARFYNPRTLMWLTQDPLAEERPDLSPYVFCAADPVNMVDPEGLSPIFDKNGYLLGCDDEGIQGIPVFMDKEDFTQGMSHADAVSANKGVDYISGGNEFSRYVFTYLSLSSRPDWDGKLTLQEARAWYRNGGGRPLYVDSSQIDLGGITMEEIRYANDHYFNLFYHPELIGQDTYRVPSSAFVYGRIRIDVDDTDSIILGRISDRLIDTYDFNYDPLPEGFKEKIKVGARNIMTYVGKVVNGKGIDYNIYTYGYGRIK